VSVDTSQLKSGPFFFGGLIGFVAGLVVAGVLAIWIYNATPFRAESTPSPKSDAAKPKVDAKPIAKAPEPAAAPRDDDKPDAARIVQPGLSTKATPEPSAPIARTEPPKVDAKPESKAKTSDAQPEPSPSAEPRGRLWLQVGAYANKQDADNQRARFAMLGYEARIESTDIPDKGTIHRVRVGPYRDPDEAAKVRGDLARQGIEVSVIKP
jgi:cell division protein FtsN